MMTRKKDEHKKHSKENMQPDDLNANAAKQEGIPTDQETEIPALEVADNEAELQEKITELTASLAASNDKYLRLSAEFDNFRKRTLKEKMDLMKNASESVIVSFLPVIDDLERALNAIEISDNLETTKEVVVETDKSIYYIKTYNEGANRYMGLLLAQAYCERKY